MELLKRWSLFEGTLSQLVKKKTPLQSDQQLFQCRTVAVVQSKGQGRQWETELEIQQKNRWFPSALETF